MKDLTIKEGFLNRHVDGLPKKKTLIEIMIPDGERILCEWNTSTIKDLPKHLGMARTIDKPWIKFHVWENLNYEFIYYKIT